MATVADRPPARKGRAPRPAAPSPAALPEGWQPGGAAPPVAPPSPAEAPAPAASPERHGICRLTLRIGGTDYRLRRFPPAPGSGLMAIWTLRKIQADPGRAPVAYAVASDGCESKCACPDHSVDGARCKHIMALVALRLIPGEEGGAL